MDARFSRAPLATKQKAVRGLLAALAVAVSFTGALLWVGDDRHCYTYLDDQPEVYLATRPGCD